MSDRILVLNVEMAFSMAENAQVFTATHNVENQLEVLMHKEMPGVELVYFDIITEGEV